MAGSGFVEFALTASASSTATASVVPSSTPPTSAEEDDSSGSQRHLAPEARRSQALRLEVEELAVLVAEIDGDRQPESDEREHERGERGRGENEE